MGLFKNGVGRPSNETLRKRRTAYLLIVAVFAGVVGIGASYISNSFENSEINGTEKNATVISAAKSGDVASEIILGGDKKITIEDLSIIQRLAAGETINGKTKDTLLKSGTKLKLADINGDNKVDGADIDILQVFLPQFKVTVKDVGLGDINKNGSLDYDDLEMLRVYIDRGNVKLSDSQLKIADVYKDGKVDNKDVEHIAKFVVKRGSYKLGDANQDGKIDSADSNLILKFAVKNPAPNSTQLLLSDIDEDGVVESEDAREITNLIGTGKVYSLGDINKNGTIDSKDLDLLKKFLNKKSTPTALQLDLGDINRDGKLTTLDSTILERYIAGYGDVVNAYNSQGDGKLTVEDFELIKNYNGVKVSSTTTASKILSELLAKESTELTSAQKSAADIDGNGTIAAADANAMFDMKNNKFNTNGAKMNGVTATYDKNTQVLTLTGTATGNIDLMSLLGQKFVEKEKYKVTLTYVSGTVEGSNSTFTTQILKKSDKSTSTGNVVNLTFPTSKTKETSKVMNINSDGAKNGTQLNSLIKKSGTLKFTNYKVKVSIVNKSILTAIFVTNGSMGSRTTVTCNTLDKTSCKVSLPKIKPANNFYILGWSKTKNATKAEIDTSFEITAPKEVTISDNTIYYAITKAVIGNDMTFISGSNYEGEYLSCELYNGAYRCAVTAPTFKTASGFTALGWYSSGDGNFIIKCKQNEKYDLSKYSNTQDSLVSASRKVVTVKFNKNNADRLSFTEESCYVYGDSSITTCGLVLAPKIYSKGNETLEGFSTSATSSRNTSHANLNNTVLDKRYDKNTTLYAIVNNEYRTSSLKIASTKYIGGVSFDVQSGVNSKLAEESIKKINNISSGMPFLFKTSGKVTLMTDDTYYSIHPIKKNGDTCGIALDDNKGEFSNTDVRVGTGCEITSTIIHEMAHLYDFYYGKKNSILISGTNDLGALYSKYYNLPIYKRPLTSHAYDNGVPGGADSSIPFEFWASAVEYYYMVFYSGENGYQSYLPKDICLLVEKYGDIPSSSSKCGSLKDFVATSNVFFVRDRNDELNLTFDTKTDILTLNGTANKVYPMGSIQSINFKKNEKYKITLTYVSGSVTNANNLMFNFELYDGNIKPTGIKTSLAIPTKAGSTTKTITVSKNISPNHLYSNISNGSNNYTFKDFKFKVNIVKVS